jgi:O-antigen/teichoic acid export membrane protein
MIENQKNKEKESFFGSSFKISLAFLLVSAVYVVIDYFIHKKEIDELYVNGTYLVIITILVYLCNFVFEQFFRYYNIKKEEREKKIETTPEGAIIGKRDELILLSIGFVLFLVLVIFNPFNIYGLLLIVILVFIGYHIHRGIKEYKELKKKLKR